jgi:hypothetical protein
MHPFAGQTPRQLPLTLALNLFFCRQRVYYLSMEWYLGRTLGNAMLNLGLQVSF